MMQGNATPLRILLVEGDDHNRRAIEYALEKANINTELTVCDQAEEAEGRLINDNERFDLVVINFDLPGMNGLEFFRKVHRRQNLPPFVMLADAGSEKIAVEALQAGIYDYIIKDPRRAYLDLLPFVLTAAVQRFVDEQVRQNTETALIEGENELGQVVQARTAAPTGTNQALENEISEHRQTATALRKSEVQLRKLSRQILEAQENERRMIAREIHDSIGGSLAAIKFALEEKLESMDKNPQPKVISLEKIM